jgi:hypothetical protein
MSYESSETRRRFLGLTGALAATGLFGVGMATADEHRDPIKTHGHDMEVFEVELAPESVVSDEDVESNATGRATAILDENRLVIGGEVTDLTSPIRDIADYADEDVGFGAPDEEDEDDEENGEDEEDQEDVTEDLLDPGVHIHEGGPDETTGYILALIAQVDEFDDMDTRYAGSFTLTQSQIVTLRNEEFYQDIHTEEFEDGELRGQVTPVEKDVELFGADLTSDAAGVEASALGKATAFLDGCELTVGGEFSGLRSELRDQTEDILDPGIRIRDGSGEAVFPLAADIDGDEGSGQFMGSFELEDEQIERLRSDEYHIDIVTEDYPDGVVRGHLESR